MSKASLLVSQAKQWAGHYGRYANGKESVPLTVALRVRGAWSANDADGVADVFAENGSMLIGDEQLNGREAIRTYLTAAFEGGLRGSSLVDEVAEIQFLDDDVALVITDGGVLDADETELPPSRTVRTMWVTSRQSDGWRLLSYQSSPVAG